MSRNEAIDSFRSLSLLVTDAALILFLNKRDVYEQQQLEQRLEQRRDLGPFFPYEDSSSDALSDRISDAPSVTDLTSTFRAAVSRSRDVGVFAHATIASDPTNVQVVWNAVSEVILMHTFRAMDGFLF